MRKFYIFALLCATTSLFAETETRVETFDTKDGKATKTYVLEETSKECQQATWTFLRGGVLKDLGNMGKENFAAVIRGKKTSEEEFAYLYSSPIANGIDSLWFTWNSNGDETPYGDWNIKIYVNDVQVGAITEPGGKKASAPFHSFGVGNLKVEGDFVIKFVNECTYDTTEDKNFMRFVIDDLSWTTYGRPVPEMSFEYSELVSHEGDELITNELTKEGDAVPTYESSNPEVASVNNKGEVTALKAGTAIITANLPASEDFTSNSASYTIRVLPANVFVETFNKVTKNCIVCPSATSCATEPVSDDLDNDLIWTYWLGGGNTEAFGGDNAMYLRARKKAEVDEEYKHGYLLSDFIEGGISRLAFEWRQGGKETGIYDVAIVINTDTIARIQDQGENSGDYKRSHFFEKKNLNVEGDFTIEIINMSERTSDDGNTMRIVIREIEWESYTQPTGVEKIAEPTNGPQKVIRDGQLFILRDGKTYNALGQIK